MLKIICGILLYRIFSFNILYFQIHLKGYWNLLYNKTILGNCMIIFNLCFSFTKITECSANEASLHAFLPHM